MCQFETSRSYEIEGVFSRSTMQKVSLFITDLLRNRSRHKRVATRRFGVREIPSVVRRWADVLRDEERVAFEVVRDVVEHRLESEEAVRR